MSDSRRAKTPKLVVLGQIVRAQGLKGEVRVSPFGVGAEVTARLIGKRLFVRSKQAHEAKCDTTLVHQRWHRGMWIVGLHDCSTREQAEDLVGCEVCLAEEDRPELGRDEFYDDQLVGSGVVDVRSGEMLGEVVAIQLSAAADLLVVHRPNGGQFLIPAVRALIKDIDCSARSIRVDLPEGLTEINVGWKGSASAVGRNRGKGEDT